MGVPASSRCNMSIHVFEDYHITMADHGYIVTFRVVPICSWNVKPDGERGEPSSFGFVAGEDREDPSEATAVVKGEIHGHDDCSNWQFDPHGKEMHFCSREQAEGLGRLMGELYRLKEETRAESLCRGVMP